jgi:MoxR-like ATPase
MVLIDLNSLTVRDKIHILRKQLNRECLEREHHIDALLALYICKNHGILLGPPGTGKTYLIELLCNALGGKFWSILASPTTKPDEFFGPVSIKALKENEDYKRNTKNRLPEAEVAYIDEIFKADMDLLNSTLKMINERVYYNPNAQSVPLRSVMASSNEVPDNGNAFMDRFIWKTWIGYIREKDNFMDLSRRKINGHKPKVTIQLASWDIEQAETEAMAIALEPMLPILYDLREKLRVKGFEISDRKWFQIYDFFRAFAWVQNKDAVDLDVIQTLLPDCIWQDPDDVAAVSKIVSDEIKEIKGKVNEVKKAIHACSDDWNNGATGSKDYRLQLATELCDRITGIIEQINELEAIGIYSKKQLNMLRELTQEFQQRLRNDVSQLDDTARKESLDKMQKLLSRAKDKYADKMEVFGIPGRTKEDQILLLQSCGDEVAAIAKEIKTLPNLTPEDFEIPLEQCRGMIRHLQAKTQPFLN